MTVKGLFIAFEGIDGSGKSLMLAKAADYLRERGRDVVCTREPGGTPLGLSLRRILLDSPPGAVGERAEALLYAADRALHVEQVIRPALAAGQVVLSDRYVDSSLAYQGGGRGLTRQAIRELNCFAMGDLWPDLTLLLDLPAELALSRLRGEKDRLEQEDIEFFRRVGEAFRALAQAEPERFVLVDASLPPERVFELIVQAIRPWLLRR